MPDLAPPPPPTKGIGYANSILLVVAAAALIDYWRGNFFKKARK